jgi:hypothetical protein
MPYTIVKSDGSILTTIADGTINTTSTSFGLPGRNYAGYGQAFNTNLVQQTENFADSSPPPNPLRGQLWFNTTNSTLYVCPTDGEGNALAWLGLASTSSGGSTTFGSIAVTGNIAGNNISIANSISGNLLSTNFLTVSSTANIANISATNANIGNLLTTSITTGSPTTNGTLTGLWNINGSAGGNSSSAMNFNTGGISISNSGGANLYGIRTDKYMYANGDPISFSGTYGNSNVAAYLPTYNGNILTLQTQTSILTTGANTTSGSITGNWTLTPGSRMQATYADIAERFESDMEYSAGTIVEIGGNKEITAVKDDLSNIVFGVVSDTAAYLLNQDAGNDITHPAIALAGRVKVKTIGKILKGDRLVSAGNGTARKGNTEEINSFNVIGRSLEDKMYDDEGIIIAIVSIVK